MLHRVVEHERRFTLAVAVLVYVPVGSPRTLLTEQSMWKELAEILPGGVLDEGNPKPHGEVLVIGSAFAPTDEPVAAVMTKLAVQRGEDVLVDKELAVLGDRYWKGSEPTDPTPFESMPVDYSHAFGGKDFEDNPLGKGVDAIESEHGELFPLPNVEDPKRLVVSPDDRPAPAGFGPYDLTWPQRFSKIGTRYDNAWLEERFPGPAEDFDATFYNTAPRDQQLEGFFEGNERIAVTGMHPSGKVIELELLPLVARAFVTQRVDSGAETKNVFKAIGTRLDTVYVFPDLERAVMIYRGTLSVSEDDADDILHLMVAAEAPGQPKPLEHYERVLAQRIDKDGGCLASLRDKDLLPPMEDGWLSRIDPGDVGEMTALEHRKLANCERGRKLKMNAAREELAAAGFDCSEAFEEEPGPPIPDPFDIDAFGEYCDEMEARIKKARAEAAENQKAAEAEARASMAKGGFDYDAVMADALLDGAGPPDFSADDHLAMLHDMARIAHEGGAPMEELERDLTDPAYEQTLRELETRVKDGYAQFAHLMPAGRQDTDLGQRHRVVVTAAKDGGESLAGRTLTGADLHDLDLSGIDLSNALLEGANLAGANLAGANLSGAVLVRADLTGTNMSSADLTKANIGGTTLKNTDLSDTTLEQTVFMRSVFDGVLLHGARLNRTDFLEAKFVAADFAHVQAHQPLFMQTDLRRVHFAGAQMTQAMFVEVDLRGVDFTGAVLKTTQFLKTRGDGATFVGAVLEKAVFVYETSFRDCAFTGADLSRANFHKTPLTSGDFTDAKLTGASLIACDLSESNMSRIVAHEALMIRTNFTRANLRGADLLGAILQKATLFGTDLSHANLSRGDISLVRTDDRTNFDSTLMLDTRVDPKYVEPKQTKPSVEVV